MELKRAYKFRLYPDAEQRQALHKTFGCCRLLYNVMLNERKEVYEWLKEDKERLYAYKYKTEREYKEEYPFLLEVDAKALQSSTWNLLVAYQNFYRGKRTGEKIGHPKFKSKKRSKESYTTHNINNNIKIDFEEKKIKLPKIKTRIVYRDKRTFDEQIRQVTVSKTKSGEYYVSILVEQEREVKIKTEIKEEKIQAFDMSFLKFLVATENEYQNPRFYRNEEKRLQRLHRRLSRKEKGSKNRTKARIDLARKYQQIKDRKKDWTHKLTHELSKEYDAIILENLNIEGMKQFNKGHAKTVTLDFSWGQFVRVLRYKMAQQGKHLVLVDRFFPSSKLCSNCDCKYDDLKLSERKWTCQECGVEHDRDRNAAKNLLKEGITILQSLGIMIKSTSGTRKVTPVEMMSDATRGAIVDEAGIHPL